MSHPPRSVIVMSTVVATDRQATWPGTGARPQETAGTVHVDGDEVRLEGVRAAAPTLAHMLGPLEPAARLRLVSDVLEVGARGFQDVKVGVDLAEVERRVQQSMRSMAELTTRIAEEAVSGAEAAVAAQLDPEARSSAMSRALASLEVQRELMAALFDPNRADSHATALVDRIGEVVGPGGLFDRLLSEALDLHDERSALSRLRRDLLVELREVREAVGREQGRAEADDVGTRKGIDFEDRVEADLRRVAAGLGAAIVTRTSRQEGALGTGCFVGDLVVEHEGSTVAVEVKNTASIGLGGGNGILAELDRAMTNRGAQAAVCVSATTAYPDEVGAFAVYGNRVLVVADEDGVLVEAAVRLALTLATMGRSGVEIDVATLADRASTIEKLAHRLKDQRRALTNVVKGIEGVRSGLADLREELLDQVGDLARSLR